MDAGLKFWLTPIAFMLATTAALAQPIPSGPPPGARGIGGGDDDGVGAYASPSAIPEGTVDERFGVPRLRQRSLDPIALPEGIGRPLEEEYSLPSLPAFAPPMLPAPNVVRPERALVLNARLNEAGPTIPEGLVWRLFSQTLNREGQLQLVALSKGGQAEFDVPPGKYLLHVGYGRAGVTKKIDFSGERSAEIITLDAGGLRLNASASTQSGEPIHSESLKFDIYSEETDGQARQLIAEDVPPGSVVRLNAGEYQVVSNYGEVNAIARADIRVEEGRITNARLQHRAAELTMKLVREAGGEALADTAWSISSSQGDIIRESVGAFSTMVLAEGDYLVVAKNRDRIYQRELSVVAGHNEEVELLVSDVAVPTDLVEGSGD